MATENDQYNRHVTALRTHEQLTEYQFRSPTPVVGALFVRLRQFWSWMASRWSTEHIIEQQNLFNHRVADSVELLLNDVAILRRDFTETTHSLIQTNQDFLGEIKRLHERNTQIYEELTGHTDELFRLSYQLSERSDNLQNQARTLGEEITACNEQAEVYNEAIASLQRDIALLGEQLADTNFLLAQREQTKLQQLRERVQRLETTLETQPHDE